MTIVDKAIDFATFYHTGQVRKYTGEEYITHPIAVSELFLSGFGGRFTAQEEEDAVVAAILHDTVEDTEAKFEDIIEKFGETVASYVWFLTKPENFVGNRAVRKGLDVARLSQAPDVVKAVKLCDLMHNSLSIKHYDPKFWKTFRAESQELVMIDSGAAFTTIASRYSNLEFFTGRYANFMQSITED